MSSISSILLHLLLITITFDHSFVQSLSTTTTTTFTTRDPIVFIRSTLQQQRTTTTITTTTTSLLAVNGDDDDSEIMKTLSKLVGTDDEEEVMEFTLEEHDPLGCTAEESLAKGDEMMVFVSKVTKGGNAEQAGIETGDVIIGLTGPIGSIVDVTKLGVERVRALVGGCPKDVPLSIRVIRGTDIMTRHESALIDLCTLSENGEGEMDRCLEDFLLGGYYGGIEEEKEGEENDDEEEEEGSVCEEDGEAECMLDRMMEGWGEELPGGSAETDKVDDDKREEMPKKRVAPWSSRSSPSGTFVRDPTTGKLVNIDR